MRTNTRKFRLALTSLVLVVGILVLPAGAALADYWPMFNRDLLNTGVADPALAGITVPMEMWSFTTDNPIGPGSPVIGDIDGDGVPEVLVPTANFGNTGGIYAFNADGSLKWKYQTGDKGTYATPPLADIDGDGKLETIFPSYDGRIVAVDDDGTEIWSVDKGSGGTRSVIADMTTDAGLEVVAGAASKTFMLRASNGVQIWEADYRMLCDPAIVDVDGDGKLEVVFSASGKIIVALNVEDGTVAWTSALMGQDAQNNLAVISDINSDGNPDIVAGARDNKVYVFSGADGAKLWDYGVVGRCFSAAVADFNGDGYDDVATTSTGGYPTKSYAYLLDVKNQTLLWQHDIVGKKYYSTERSPSIADVNGDGTPDVLIAGLSQNLYALSGVDGSEIWTIATNDPSAGVPAIGDLDGDGNMEIVVSAGSSVQVFTQEPPPPTIVWVDDDWTSQGDVDIYDPSLTWQYNAFNSLQDGIDAVPSGTASKRSIVNVFNGDYQTPEQTIGGYKTGILVESLDYLTIQAVPGNEPTAKPLAGGGTSLGIESSNHIIIDNIDLDGSLAGFDRLHVRNSNYITLKNSEIADGSDGIDVETGGKHFVIENNVFHTLSGDAVDFSDGEYSDITIQDNIFHSDNRRPILIRNLGDLPIGDFIIRRNISLGTNNQEAFRIIGASNVLIENNVIANSRQQGLYIDTKLSGGTTSSNITVRHNTFFNNGSDPEDNGEIKTKVVSSDIVIQNNIIYGNGSNPAFETSVTSLPGEDSNLVYNTADGLFTFGLNTITGSDPLFVSTTPGSEDLHLQAGSPAIEAGTDLGVSDDVEKNSRPNPAGTDPDIGAYEMPFVSMASFVVDHAKLDFKTKPNDDKVRVQGRLELDLACGDGVDVSKPVTVTVGPLSETITMVEEGKKGDKWEYKRPRHSDGFITHMTIDWKHGKFDIHMDKADLTGVINPVTISILIGDDVGSTSILMNEKKHHWDYRASKPKAAEIEPFGIVDELEVVAYPNPIRDVHTATFQVMGTLAAEVEEIRVQIYDLSGHLVWEDAALGSELDWHTNSLSGDYLANGFYLYRVQVRIGASWIIQDTGKIAVLR